MDEVITTKRGNFGFIRVTIPISIKDTLLTWHKRSGMGKAEFFRAALLIGSNHLAESISAKKPGEGYENNHDRNISC